MLGGYAGTDASQMDYLTDVIKCTLHTATYVPLRNTHDKFADATNELTTANGYTAGGITIAGKTMVQGTTITTFDMDDTTVTWTAVTGNLVFQYAVFHDDSITVGPPIKPLIGYIDCGAQTITPGNSFTITTGANGLFQATVT